MLQIAAGHDPREVEGFEVCKWSAWRHTSEPLRIIPLMEKCLRHRGLYRRPHEERDGKLWCPISKAPLSTAFANSRFLAPWLAEDGARWVLFCDFADMLWLADPAELFALADDRYAVQVVKREYIPRETTKMDGQAQMSYGRKMWSSFMLWNIEHPGNARLTLDMVNELPGRDLHRFCWLEDDEIGDLPAAWNHLVGIDHPRGHAIKCLHFTLGAPFMPGYEDGPWSEVWHRERRVMEGFYGRGFS